MKSGSGERVHSLDRLMPYAVDSGLELHGIVGHGSATGKQQLRGGQEYVFVPG